MDSPANHTETVNKRVIGPETVGANWDDPERCRRRFGIRDAKRLNRERETLIRETTRLVNRMKPV